MPRKQSAKPRGIISQATGNDSLPASAGNPTRALCERCIYRCPDWHAIHRLVDALRRDSDTGTKRFPIVCPKDGQKHHVEVVVCV